MNVVKTEKKQINKGKGVLKRKIIILVSIVVLLAVFIKFFLPQIMFPEFEPVKVTGEYTVITDTYTWIDESRTETFSDKGEKRALTVKFWYPEEDGNYPLIVFSHGAFGVIDSNDSTCKELASNGYVVVSIGHPYHAMFVEDVHGKTTIVDMDFVKRVYSDNGADDPEAERRVYEFSKEWMAVRTGDMHFVLNTVLEKNKSKEEGPFRKLDAEHIGVFGHSMGGATAVQIGRERNDIDAVIDLEGTMAGEYIGFENGCEIYNEVPYPLPVLDINSKAVRDDIEELKKEHEGWEYVNDYLGRNAVCYREIIFYDAGHLNFTDLPLFSPITAKVLGVGEVNPRECIENVNEAVLIFFDFYLKGKGTLEKLQSEY